MHKACHDSIESYFEELYFFNTEKIQNGQIEYCGKQALIPYEVKYTGESVYIYGCGRNGFYISAWLKREKCTARGFIDRDPDKQGKCFMGMPIMSIDYFSDTINNSKEKALVLISTALGDEEDKIKERLLSISNVSRIIDITASDLYDSPASALAYDFYNNKEKLKKVLDSLFDLDSKKVLCEIIRAAFFNDFFRGFVGPSSDKYWGDELFDINKCKDILITGGGIGDTIFYYLQKNKKFDHITIFEPEFEIINKNISILPMEMKEKICVVPKKMGTSCNEEFIGGDDFLDMNNPSIITMDIEGGECDALHSLKGVISRERTIFAISAYHYWDDLINFIDIFASTNDYVYALRKYASLYRMNINETVFYAIPKCMLKCNEE